MPEVTVATCNTHWCLDRHRWPIDLVAALSVADADVVMLQEVWRPDAGPGPVARAAVALGYAVHHLPLGRGARGARRPLSVPARWARGDWGLAVLTRLPVAAVHPVGLGRLPRDPVSRAALRLDLDLGGRRLTVVATHLAHLSRGSLLQLHRLRARLPGAGEAAVLGGDMNMWGPLLAANLPGWRRAARGRTWPALLPHSQIDHLLVTPRVGVVGGGVLPDVGSDHRGLRAVLRLG